MPFATITKTGAKACATARPGIPAVEDIAVHASTFDPPVSAHSNKRATKRMYASQPLALSSTHPSPSKKSKAKTKRPIANDDDDIEAPSQSFGTKIIRRVQAIVDIPIKEEEDSDYDQGHGSPMAASPSYVNVNPPRRSDFGHGGEPTGESDEHTSEDEDDELRINAEVSSIVS
jgi:hypothetical protein